MMNGRIDMARVQAIAFDPYLQGHGTRGRGFQGRPEAEKANIHLKRQSRPENGWLCLFLFRIEVRPVRRYRFRSNRASSTPPSRMAKSARFQT